jgi:2'-phosphotransferase
MTMTSAGWVPVQEFLESKHLRLKGMTLEAIEEVVATSDKQRFALSYRPTSDFPGKKSSAEEILCIRANQGHSIKTLDPNLILRRLTPEEIHSLSCVVHGTSVDAWKSIEQQGLKTMNRTHIHFATGLPDNEQVISGMRRSATVYIYIDVETCMDDGIEFYKSANGVVLSEGTNGIIGTKYFLKVTDSTGNMIMSHDGAKNASFTN